MKAYAITFIRKGNKVAETKLVDASSVKYAKNKIERQLKTKIKITDYRIVGYY